MSYDQMSDFEINALVAKTLGMKVETVIGQGGFTEDYHSRYPHTIWAAECDDAGDQVEPWEQKVFTHSWDDMGPIISENKICINYDFDGSGGGSCTTNGRFFVDFCRGGELRAAAIAYLMSNGG